jgi:hypothetical protein
MEKEEVVDMMTRYLLGAVKEEVADIEGVEKEGDMVNE